MTSTELFVEALARLRSGDLAMLRAHAGQGLDESLQAFDLFTGLWWPVRQRNQRAPRREVGVAGWPSCTHTAHLLHLPGRRSRANCVGASRTMNDSARGFGRCLTCFWNHPSRRWNRFFSGRCARLRHCRCKPAVRPRLDWARLTDDLSLWHREKTKLSWAAEYVNHYERNTVC